MSYRFGSVSRAFGVVAAVVVAVAGCSQKAAPKKGGMHVQGESVSVVVKPAKLISSGFVTEVTKTLQAEKIIDMGTTTLADKFKTFVGVKPGDVDAVYVSANPEAEKFLATVVGTVDLEKSGMLDAIGGQAGVKIEQTGEHKGKKLVGVKGQDEAAGCFVAADRFVMGHVESLKKGIESASADGAAPSKAMTDLVAKASAGAAVVVAVLPPSGMPLNNPVVSSVKKSDDIKAVLFTITAESALGLAVEVEFASAAMASELVDAAKKQLEGVRPMVGAMIPGDDGKAVLGTIDSIKLTSTGAKFNAAISLDAGIVKAVAPLLKNMLPAML